MIIEVDLYWVVICLIKVLDLVDLGFFLLVSKSFFLGEVRSEILVNKFMLFF